MRCILTERDARQIIYVSDETHRALKLLSASSGLTMTMIADALIRHVIKDKELTRRILEDIGGKVPEE